MAVQDYGRIMQSAADFAMTPYNSLMAGREYAAQEQRRNALIQNERDKLAYQQQKAADEQQASAAEDAAWEQAYAAKDWGTMARIDPQAAQILWAHEQQSKPPEPPAPINPVSRSGYSYLEQGGKIIPGSVQTPQRMPITAGGGASPAEQYQVIPPEQARALGLPEGTVAQRGPNGKIDVVSAKPQQTLTPKDASAARVKLRQIALAKQQLALVRKRYEAIRNTFSSGVGGNYVPTVAGKAADAAVNSMRDSITSITRTPGIGAMSDFETRLQQAKFPDRGQYEDVSAQQIQSLQDMLDQLQQGYSEMLNDGGTSSPSTAAPTQPKRTVKFGDL